MLDTNKLGVNRDTYMMQELFAFLNQGWVGSLIGTIGIVLGVLGIFSYRISKSRSKPTIQKHSLRIIGKEDSEISADLEILYKGIKVERLTKTIIVFWNDGTETINGNDVVDSDKISFRFSEGESILSSKIIAFTREVNNASVIKDQKHEHIAGLTFEFFDPNDGVTIEFLHTDKERYPSITGTIKGVPDGICDAGRYIGESTQLSKTPFDLIFKNRKKLMYFTLAAGLVTFAIGLLPSSVYEYVDSLMKPDLKETGGVPERWFFIIFGGIYAFMAVFVLWVGRRKYPKALWYDEEGS